MKLLTGNTEVRNIRIDKKEELNTLLNFDERLIKEEIWSLPEIQLNFIVKEVAKIVEGLKEEREKDLHLKDFIEHDHKKLLNNRLSDLKRQSGELSYDVLNKDKVLNNLKSKINAKASIQQLIQKISKKHDLTDFNMSIEFLRAILELKDVLQKIEYREGDIFNEFERIYDEIVFPLQVTFNSELKLECFNFFKGIRNIIKKGTKYRNPERLSPIVIFMFFKKKGFELSLKDVAKGADITEKGLKKGLQEINKIKPVSFNKERKALILKKIENVKRNFRLPDDFLGNSTAILEKFWPYLSNTTENVAAATVCVLTTIAMDIEGHTSSQICKHIGIAQSAVLYQIKNKLFKRLNVPGFQSVQKSKEMIKVLIEKNVDIKTSKDISFPTSLKDVQVQLKEHLKSGGDWKKIDSTIPGVSIVKVPATKSRLPLLYLEINPLENDGKPLKKKGLFIGNRDELIKFSEILKDDVISRLINEIEKVNPKGSFI